MNLNIYDELMFNKGALIMQWKKKSFQWRVNGILQRMNLDLYHTMYSSICKLKRL
jgi:hypothetical protein